MHDIVSDDDSIPGLIDDSDDDSPSGLIDDSDSDDDTDVTIRHVRRRLPLQSRVDPSNRSFQGVYVAGRTSAVRIVDDNISGPSVYRSLELLSWKKSVPIHFGVTFSSIEVNRTTSSAYIKHRFMVFVS